MSRPEFPARLLRPMSITFALLGPVRAHRDDRELRLGTPQQRGTLAVLLLRAGRLVTVDELVDALWERPRPPETAVAAVRTYLLRLRGILDAPPGEPRVRIDWRDGGYVFLAPAYSLDVTRFQRHTQRAADARRRVTWRAPRSSCAAPPPCTADHPWRAVPSCTLTPYAFPKWAAKLRWTLAAVTMELGHPAEAVSRLRALLADDPLTERARPGRPPPGGAGALSPPVSDSRPRAGHRAEPRSPGARRRYFVTA